MVRNHSLDGLRGLAALGVVISHIFPAFYPAVFVGGGGGPPTFASEFAASPLFVLINGNFAVFVFFVLSGYVIAGSADKTTASLLGNCLARVVRLSLPCIAAVLFAALLFTTRLEWSSRAAEIVDHPWLRGAARDLPLSYIVAEIVAGFYWKGHSLLNSPLWTMQRELIGSLAIYVAFALARTPAARLATAALAALAVSIFRLEIQHYICFAAGAALYLQRHRFPLPTWIGLSALAFGLFLGGRPIHSPPPETVYSGLHLPYVWTLCWPCGATLILIGVLSLGNASLLNLPPLKFLGRISFGLYLIHFPILLTLAAWLFVIWGHTGPVAGAICASIFLAASIVAGWIFTLLVDEPTIRLASRLRNLQLVSRFRRSPGFEARLRRDLRNHKGH